MNERTVKRYHLHFHFKKAVFIEAPLIQLNFDLNADTFKNEEILQLHTGEYL